MARTSRAAAARLKAMIGNATRAERPYAAVRMAHTITLRSWSFRLACAGASPTGSPTRVLWVYWFLRPPASTASNAC